MTTGGARPQTAGNPAGKKKRVLFLIGQLGHGGSEKQMALTALGLKERFDVEVLCATATPDPHGRILQNGGVPVHCPPPGGRLARLFWVCRMARSLRGEILFVFSIRNSLALLVSLLTGGKLVFTERSLGVWKSRSYLWVDGFLYRRAAIIPVNSRATADFIARRFPRAAGKLRVIYNGIATEGVEAPQPFAGPLVTFCLVGGLRPWKGHLGLVEAAALLAEERRDFRVLLVGDGPERSAVEELVAEKGLGDLFELAGWQEDPNPFLARSDVSLNVSSHESLSNAVMEGMLMGRPSVVTGVGGNPELVEDGVHGRVVPYGDARALASAMRACMEDRANALKWGAAARQKIIGGFSEESAVRQTGDLLECL